MSDVSDFFAGNFVHLGLGATTVAPPMHTADGEWYAQAAPRLSRKKHPTAA